eukprot:TRINITY_DN4585_c0_g1_i7.p2 TRINITY_DN4585_c0_g1~~TRINITY_DN4585_c0_g1_i7.p2  ORF type:complete len:109 (-),score=13.31 TRINITY_DN4585_c0_g1_i7:301-627(-)
MHSISVVPSGCDIVSACSSHSPYAVFAEVYTNPLPFIASSIYTAVSPQSSTVHASLAFSRVVTSAPAACFSTYRSCLQPTIMMSYWRSSRPCSSQNSSISSNQLLASC